MKNKALQKKSQESRKIFIGGLPKGLEFEEFKEYFSKFGEIEDIAIIHNKETKDPRGFGFVTYVNHHSIDLVLNNYNGHYFQNKWVEVKMANPRISNEDEIANFYKMNQDFMKFTRVLKDTKYFLNIH